MAETQQQTKKRGYEKVVTPVARVAFPHLKSPDVGRQFSDGKYKATLLFDKSTDLKAMKEACVKAARQIWPNIEAKQIRMPFRDGDKMISRKTNEVLDGHKGAYVIIAKTKDKPGTCGPKKEQLTEGQEIYGGCYARASLTAATYEKEVTIMKEDGQEETKKIPAVTFYLNALQFVKNGPRFGGVSGGVGDFDDTEFDDAPDGGLPKDDDLPF